MTSFDTPTLTQPKILFSTFPMKRDEAHKRESATLTGGSIPGKRGHGAFVLTQPNPPPIPILIAVPHAGRVYPSNLVEQMRNPAVAALRLEDRLIDLVADAVATETGASLLVAKAPRAMIDLNRSPDDIDWDMVAGGGPTSKQPRLAAGRRARSGLGLVPRRLPGMGELWKSRMTDADLVARIEQVHVPYHRQLAATLADLRDRWGTALLIDLHSMPPLGPKAGPHRAADFVLGDRFGASCTSALVKVAINHLEAAGHPAAHNRPYAGGYVLDRHGAPLRGLNALQVEVCRLTYLDDVMCDPGKGLETVVSTLTGLVRAMADELSAGSPSLALAAE